MPVPWRCFGYIIYSQFSLTFAPVKPAPSPGERIVAVDKAPELPESIRHLVMHVARSARDGRSTGRISLLATRIGNGGTQT